MSTALSDAGLQFASGDTQAYPVVPVRQTVLSGTVDSNGFSSFGGSTGTATVTAATTLVATAANGVSNRTGSIVNPSWTGLSTNGTMYGYMDVNADGTCTVGSGTLAPIYQWGGTPSVTNGQFTFNIQEMKGYVGNGSTATQIYRVYVGEFTVAGGVVTAIIWYQLMARYISAATAWTTAASVSFNHYIGINIEQLKITAFNSQNTTGPWLPNPQSFASYFFNDTGLFGSTSRLGIRVHPAASGINYDNGSNAGSTITSGYMLLNAQRTW